MIRSLLALLFLIVISPVSAQSLPLAAVEVTIVSGQQTTKLRTDAQGRLFITVGGPWKEVGRIDSSGTLVTAPGNPSLELDSEGSFVADGDITPLRLDDNATVSMSGLDIFRVQTLSFVAMEPIAQALGRDIHSVRITGSTAGDKLAAYLVVLYVLMV